MGPEIATAFVRVRANTTGLAAQISEGVRVAMSEAQQGIASMAAEGASAAKEQVAQLDLVSAGYREVGAAAVKSATVAKEASAGAAAAIGEETAAGVAKAKASLTGLKGGFMSFGKLLGIGFGAYFAVKFGKDIIGAAAAVQKSQEVVRAQFGASGEAITKFAGGAAAQLGISNKVALDSAARFGILFRNLNIAQPVAAKMTLGFEQLVGALSAVRGVDPTSVMQRIVLAAAGNTRGLKQLGIVVDASSEKVAAFKLGLISSMSQALTPAIKTQAIYAIATAHLAKFQSEAAKHSGDLANVQLRLGAAWSNAKERLAVGLLPVLSKLLVFLSSALPRVMAGASAAAHVFGLGFHLLGKAIEPVIGFITRFKSVFIPVGAAIGGAVGAIVAITMAMKLWSVATAIATKAQIALGLAEEASPIGLIITAVAALAAGMYVLYNRSATVRRILDETWSGIKNAAAVAIPFIQNLIAKFVAFAERVWRDWGSTIMSVVRIAWNTVKGVVDGALKTVRGIFDVFKGLFTGDWSEMWKGLKGIVSGELQAIISVVKGWGSTIAAVFEGIWKNIELGALKGIAYILNLINKIPTSFHIFGKKVGFTNPAGAALKGIQGIISGIEASDAAQATADAIARNTAGALKAKTTDPQMYTAGKDVGKKVVKAVVDGITSTSTGTTGGGTGGGSPVGNAVANTIFNDSVKAAIDNANKKLAAAIKAGNSDVSKAAVAATKNLSSISDKLTATLAKFYTAGGGPTTVGSGLPGGALSAQFTRLKALIASGAPQSAIANAAQTLSAQLSAKQAKAGGPAQIAKEHISTLIDEFNKGQLTAHQVQSNLLTFLRSQGVTYKTVGKLWGKGLRDGMWGELTALFAQLKAIGAEPASLRKLSQHTAASGGLKIVDPADARRKADAKIAAARHAEQLVLQKEHLRILKHGQTLQKQATVAAKKTAKAAAATAATNAALAGTQVNGSAFRTSPATNPGKVSRDARANATGGLPSG